MTTPDFEHVGTTSTPRWMINQGDDREIFLSTQQIRYFDEFRAVYTSMPPNRMGMNPLAIEGDEEHQALECELIDGLPYLTLTQLQGMVATVRARRAAVQHELNEDTVEPLDEEDENA